MENGLFPAFGGMTKEERDSGVVRAFKGDGTSFLRVPGLVTLQSVRVGESPLPLTVRQKFPSNEGFEEKVRAEWPLVQVAPDPADGCPTLIRSIQSNDGIWQDGATIYVGGEWETKPQKPMPAANERK